MNNAIFITGTDTGVGKTVVTGLLANFFTCKGVKTITQKWVQTGKSFEGSSDISGHVNFFDGRQYINEYGCDMAPYVFDFPSSPHLSAMLEGKRIDVARIKDSFRSLTENFDLVLIEGTGGVLVPIDDDRLMIDIVNDLHLPVLLVAENRLGAINQTLLAVEALRQRNLDEVGVLFNRISNEANELVLKDNIRIIGKVGKVNILGELQYGADNVILYEKFLPIGEKVFSFWQKNVVTVRS